jgi:uncharacterized protein (DUF2062 family)
MVFKRRDKPRLLVRLREAVAPRGGWRRAIEYLGHRVRRLPDTPHRIGLGFAAGVFASFTPFFGVHFLIALAIAKLIRGNLFAALIGTFVGNPLTFPLIAGTSLALGRRILGVGGPTGRSLERVASAFATAADGLWHTFLSLFGLGSSQWSRVAVVWSDVMLPYLVGGLLPGVVTAVVCYWLVRTLVTVFRAARRARMLKRAHDRLEAEQSPADAMAAEAYKRGSPRSDASQDP